MAYIKKLVMQGFKSFARRTEIPFENSMNVIVGPNGSGKSNITDALCFVLGRLSIKSIRAAKAANLIFSGNKTYKASQEAYVELIFDNSDKAFSINSGEVAIRRIVRKNGNSIYKINGETKTRQDLIELLSTAGIDPNGFNIVLQGEIQSLVKSGPEERRKIIEEVAGISIYEARKQKSLRELEKTEEKLKEVSAVLKERNSYLKNLEKERADALNYKKLEKSLRRCKASLLNLSLKEKEKEVWAVDKEIESHNSQIEKIRMKLSSHREGIKELDKKIEDVSKRISTATSDEQEVLHRELGELRADLAGLRVREENFRNRASSCMAKIEDYRKKIEELEGQISKIKIKSPEVREKQSEIRRLQKHFDMLEQKRRKFYLLRSEISTMESQRDEKSRLLAESEKELSIIQKNLEKTLSEVKYAKSFHEIEKIRESSKKELESISLKISDLRSKTASFEKEIVVLETEISREEKLKSDIESLDLCPVCKQKVTENHKHSVAKTAEEKIGPAKKSIEKMLKQKESFLDEIEELSQKKKELESKISELEVDEMRLKGHSEMSERSKELSTRINELKSDIKFLNEKLSALKKEMASLKGVEEEYDEARVALQEASFSEIDLEADISLKQREINRLGIELKANIRDLEESNVEARKISLQIEEKEKLILRKEEKEQELYEKFQKFFAERSELEDRKKVLETDIIGFEHTIRSFEEKINNAKILRAQFLAQIDALKEELAAFGEIEFIKAPADQIKEKLQKTQFRLSRLGNVNMRSLDVFDKVAEQCRLIREKVESIEKEKEKIEKIITEIDRKKKKSFMSTLNSINEYFTRNFSQLSNKGEVFLELENKKEPFEGGLNILIRVSRGRYFDITSLSGGEKTLVALALIFSIQEYKPYCFYIFDEIDAALDKRNSELLAALIKKYMTSGQYIIITHNDTLISEATNLYGVSMQENISKVISLKL